MLKLLKYLLSVSIFWFFATSASAIEFIEGLEDIPIANGLKQQPLDDISFGNEESRFVEAILSGQKVRFASVEKFYQDTLPQMGWHFQGRKKNSLYFYRDREILEITRENIQPLTIRITVKSKN